MSNEHDKPKPKSGDVDPEATVTLQRDSLAAPPADDDATVMIPAMKAEPEVDEDATVMMQAIKSEPEPAPDADATVMMSPAVAAELAAAAGGEKPDFDPDATNVFVPPPPPPPSPPASGASAAPVSPPPAANTPWNAIAGGVVVLLVILYFAFGGKETPPPAPKVEVAATPAPIAAPATAPASEAAPAGATSPAPAAETPAPVAATPAPAPTPVPAAPPVATASVTSLLAGEIKRGLVDINEAGGVATIMLRDARQFDAGDVDPEARLRPVLQAIAAALDKVPGAIVVTGHADTSPSGDTRFPTNKELSTARAEAAAKVMAEKLRDPARLKSEGASDTEPLVPNDSVANRAKNRRVVIVVKPAA